MRRTLPRSVVKSSLMLFLIGLAHVAWSQQAVTGKVTAEDGQGLPGVNVIIEGTATGTTTDAAGDYTIEVKSADAVLVFSFIGYKSQRIPVGNQTSVQVKLEPDLQSLEEVVVVGYGTMAKRDVSGAIGSINTETISQRQAVNVFEAMQGSIAGVQVSSNSGAPGDGSSIIIRGASTLSDGAITPLFIVDGMIVKSIDGLNPNDIKSIEVLKDGASAAIYGARSANGVIIITTKTGEEGKPRLDVRYLRSYSSIANTLPQVNKFERVLNHSSTRGAQLEKYNANPDSVGLISSTSNNYQELLTRTAVRSDVGLSISGGTEKLRYFNSLNYIDEEGVILTSYNKKATMRTNVDYTANNWLKFGSRLSLSYRKTNNISEGDVLGWALKRITDYIIWYPDGTLAPVYAMGGQRNPIQELYARKRITNYYEGNFNQYIELKINDWLQFRASGTGNLSLRRFNEIRGKDLDSNGNEDIRQSAGREESDWVWSTLADAYFTANKTFGGDHNVSAMIGGSVENGRTDRQRFEGTRFVTENGLDEDEDGLYSMNLLTLNPSRTYSNSEDYAIAGLFSRWNYSYKGRYILSATVRADGSSKFGANNRWGVFPSASIGWRFSEESFMKWTNNLLSDGKIRVSYGTNGNDQALGSYESQIRYEAGTSDLLHMYNGIGGLTSATVYGNPDVRWEETKQTDLGIDLDFLGGRILFTSDYYVKTTKDLISSVNLPTSTGYTSVKKNLASIENKGVEISITAYPLPRTQNFSWSTTVNWAQNRNRILDLARDNYVHSNIWYVSAGAPAGNFYGYEQLGIYQYDASNAYSADYATRLMPVVQRDDMGNVIIGLNGQPTVEAYLLPNGEVYSGEVKQLTVNGVVARGGDVIWSNLPDQTGAYDNKIDDSDRKLLGNAQPKFDLGWTNSFTYKNWNLTFNFYVRWGGTIYNKFKHGYASWGGNLHNQYPDYVRTGWKWPGQITDWYWISNDRNYNYRELSSFYLEEGSFIRLRNIRLTYQLDAELTRKILMNNVQLYVYGNNLFTWTNYTGYDPEIGGGVLTPGRDDAKYPRKREIGFGLNVSF